MGSHSFSIDKFKEQSDDHIDEAKNINELGEKFLEDKEKIEDAISRVENANFSSDEKKSLISSLEESLKKVQDEYKEKVQRQEEKIRESEKSLVREIEEAEKEMNDLKDSLEEVTMEAADTDTTEAVNSAAENKEKLNQLKEYLLKQVEIQQDNNEDQREKILKRRF